MTRRRDAAEGAGADAKGQSAPSPPSFRRLKRRARAEQASKSPDVSTGPSASSQKNQAATVRQNAGPARRAGVRRRSQQRTTSRRHVMLYIPKLSLKYSSSHTYVHTLGR